MRFSFMDDFLKQHILSSAVGSHDRYCEGHAGQNRYLTALVMGIGSFPRTFSHQGSELLDRVLAYDSAEIDDVYLGQINMTLVSSFCGPEGLIWGYDVARAENLSLSTMAGKKLLEPAKVHVRSGQGLRDAARMLFGTATERHFPFFPGSHVFCAGKFRFVWGPVQLYAAVAIGIPVERTRAACVLMEDVGKFLIRDAKTFEERKDEILLHMAQSVLEVGKNQGVECNEIFVDCIVKNIPDGSVGCPMVAMPYFRLAMNAYDEHLHEQSLGDWAERKSGLFLSRS